ncbi:MAG: Tartrate dehydratase beta subunit/Fumarate hydratase class I C-terminal domain FumA [Candidatus Methanohalarchaeum thermophilum]|uniref:Tartrate dehydratase beta subunit/Fumarate hydratase class I C-terminal domain FumA n=1 Tax=Methanohalarchaeum thermophilum TaxID=1903181 RepID=A0A1Q6DUJ8_METT1|nr:MAG: Tartrate dehydratase beta subunit/Fumarate hydratase class I C-terminal domain FumA [Candidatus Methanohalarchaeum thermophilum]
MKKLKTPLNENLLTKLKAGEKIKLSGKIFTARDAAHERILSRNSLSFSLENQVIYHCGPLVSKKNKDWEIISAGPTTSTRLSKFISPLLEKYKVSAMIGKAGLDKTTFTSLKEHKCVYFSYTGGAGALASKHIEKVKDVYWLDLGEPEAVWELKIKDFPLIVGIDTFGNSIY